MRECYIHLEQKGVLTLKFKYLESKDKPAAMTEFMASNRIRPEEIYLYEKYFNEIKNAIHAMLALMKRKILF